VVCGRSWGSRPGSRNLPIKSSKDVSSLMEAGKAALRDRSEEATVGGWLKSARQGGSSDGCGSP
jgi:hypothetical protein